MLLNYIIIINLSLITLSNIFIVESSSLQLYDSTQVKPVELAAVGRVAKLAELYDARSDQFLHLSLIKSNLPANTSTSTQNKQTKLKYSMINTLEEKFRTMDISADLKLSIMGGMFDLEGSGRFFKDTKRSAKSAKASLFSSFSTEYEQISITGSEVRNLIDLNTLEQIDATHVVVGIQWGGNVFISVEDTNYDDRDQQIVEGNLNAQLQLLAVQISGQAQVKIDEKERNELAKFSFEIYGDLLPETTPQTLIDAVVFMKSAPKLLLDGNKGKGKAMKYTLIPISLLRQLLKITAKINTLSNTVDEATVDSCTKLFDDLSKVEQKLNDLTDELKKYEKFILSKKITELEDIRQNFKIFQSDVQRNLSEHLVLVRSGNETVSKLRTVLTQAYKNPYSLGNIKLDQFNPLKREFKFLKMLSDLKVMILDKEDTVQDYLSLNFNKDIYTFFYKGEFPDLNEKAMVNFRKSLDKRQNFGPNALFTAIKHDILSETEAKLYFNFNGSTKLSLYRNGKKLIDNFEVDTKIPPNNDPALWSFYYMQTQLSNLINNYHKSQSNPVPVGYIHIQLPGQSEPASLWPNVHWVEVSTQYAGLFFRVLGGGSAGFGAEQGQSAPRLLAAQYHGLPGNWKSPGQINIVPGTWSPTIRTGPVNPVTDESIDSLSFLVGNEEVRPRNRAMRIWRRDK